MEETLFTTQKIILLVFFFVSLIFVGFAFSYVYLTKINAKLEKIHELIIDLKFEPKKIVKRVVKKPSIKE